MRTDDNIADFFTKPFTKQANKFHTMRRIIMNEGACSSPEVPPRSAGGRPNADA